MIRVLHVVSVMDVGGMESFIMNLYRRVDRAEIQFDFLVHHARRGAFEDEIERLGGRVYHLTLMDDFNLIKYTRQLKKLFDAHPEYRIVHGHLASPAYFYLREAARHGISTRILHSHIADYERTPKGRIKRRLFRFSPRYASLRFACSAAAGNFLFGAEDFEIVPNGIDTAAFVYNASVRERMRAALGMENAFILGMVGRLNVQKNHPFMLRAFAALHERMPDARLIIIGVGEQMAETVRLADSLGVADAVRFVGLQSNIADWYSAMDVFVMPSFSEGFPLVGIEAQCAALPCLFSDRVPQEIALTDGAQFLPIGEAGVAHWVRAIEALRSERRGRDASVPERIRKYDIKRVTETMTEKYTAPGR